MNDSPKNQRLQGESYESKLPIFVHGDLDDYGLNPFEFRLYTRIVRRAGKDGECYESMPHIAKGCRMSEGTLKKVLPRLVELNAVTKVSRPGKSAIYRPNPLDLWKPRSNMTQVKSDLPPRSNMTQHPDLTDLPPRSNMTHEVTPLSSSLEVSPHNNSSGGDGLSSVQDALLSDLTTAVQSEATCRNEARDPGKDKNSALPANWEARAERLGVKPYKPPLLKVVENYPDHIDDAIAALKEAIDNGTQIRDPTKWLTSAIREGYQPEKPCQTQPSIPPIADDVERPVYGTKEYWEWDEKRRQSA